MRLAGEHETRVNLALFQREMLVHLNAAADQPSATRAADATLACVRRVRAHPQRRVENSLAIRIDAERRATTVEDDGHVRGIRRHRRGRGPLRFSHWAW